MNLGSDDEAQAVVAFFKQYNSMGGFELTDDNGSITSVRVNFVPHTKYSRQKSNSNNPLLLYKRNLNNFLAYAHSFKTF